MSQDAIDAARVLRDTIVAACAVVNVVALAITAFALTKRGANII